MMSLLLFSETDQNTLNRRLMVFPLVCRKVVPLGYYFWNIVYILIANCAVNLLIMLQFDC